jgi:hypothetical protein
MECGQANEKQGASSKEGKERVLFSTNMATDKEDSDSGNVEQYGSKLDSAVARFHAWKFGSGDKKASDKRHGLKVQGSGHAKKQKTPIKNSVKDAI